MGLPDEVRVFPAHGAGSACGKNLSTERQSTIGEQRTAQLRLPADERGRFLALVTAGQPAAPEYFVYDAILNRQDRELFDAERPCRPLAAARTLEAALAAGATVLDARDVAEFAAGHLSGSLNVPADGRFAETAGMVLRPDDTVVVVVAPEDRETEVAVRLGPDRLRPRRSATCRTSRR